MAGDGLAAAFATHRAQLLRYLRARGAGEEAEDCLQDLWIRVQTVSTDMATDPRAYLYRMAHNLLLDRRRSEIRRGRRDTAYHDDVQAGGEADEAPAAERILIAREKLRRVEATLRGLGARTDHIFRRHRIDEIPQRDIAAELGLSLSAVEKHLQKAYRAIAALPGTDLFAHDVPIDGKGGAA